MPANTEGVDGVAGRQGAKPKTAFSILGMARDTSLGLPYSSICLINLQAVNHVSTSSKLPTLQKLLFPPDIQFVTLFRSC